MPLLNLGSSMLNRSGSISEDIDINSLWHHIRIMKSSSHKIRITVEENVARWLRIEAARKNTSVSRFLSGILKERMSDDANYEAAKDRALARKPFFKSDGRYLTREEAHDRLR